MPTTDWGEIVSQTMTIPPGTPRRCAYCHTIVDDRGGRCPRGCGSVGFRPPCCCVCLGPVDSAGDCAKKCCS